jgi:hypothetical protein
MPNNTVRVEGLTAPIRIAPFAPCVNGGGISDGSRFSVGKSVFNVVPFTDYRNGDRVIDFLTAGATGTSRPLSDLMEGMFINGPTTIHQGGFGRVTNDWPALAMCGDDDLTLAEISQRGDVLIPNVGEGGVAERLSPYAGQLMALGENELRDRGQSGDYRKVDAIRGFRIIKIYDDENLKQGLCWVMPTAPQQLGYESHMTVAVRGSNPPLLEGDSGVLEMGRTGGESITDPSGYLPDRYSAAILAESLGGLNEVNNSNPGELWFMKAGIYDLYMTFRVMFSAFDGSLNGPPIGSTSTVPEVTLAIGLQDVTEPGVAEITIDQDAFTAEHGGVPDLIFERVFLPIASIVGGYANPKFTFASAHRRFNFFTRVIVRRRTNVDWDDPIGSAAKLRLVWNKWGNDIPVAMLEGRGLIRLVVDRSRPEDYAENQ